MNETPRSIEYSTSGATLYLAFELGNKEWKLGFTIGLGQSPRRRKIDAGNPAALEREIGRAKKRFGLPETAPVLSCYEAGRDGFWLHRYLVVSGIENLVVDSTSIEVSRWFQRRFAHGSKRVRKIGIVALACKLLVAFWRYLAFGEIPAGAQLKT